MQPCFLRSVTSADGEESVFSQYAEMELTPLSAVLRYTQGDGRVFLRVSREGVLVEREGDYALKLYLSEGQTTAGVLGLSGTEGKVETSAHRIGFSIGENSLLLSMKYTLRFDSGKQEMNVRLVAQGKKFSEEE